MWEVLDLIQKLLLYVALVCLVGPIAANRSLASITGFSLPNALGIYFGIAAIIVLLLTIPQSAYRLGDVFDSSLYQLLLVGPVGIGLLLKLIGFITLIISFQSTRVQWIGCAFLLSGFSVVGHVPAENRWLGALIAIHLLAACWWYGGLLFLRRAVGQLSTESLHSLLLIFSSRAVWVVSALLILGFIMLAYLMGYDPSEWNRHYLAYLVGKLTLALILLGFACYNKFVLTEELGRTTSVKRQSLVLKRLKSAIEMELVLFTTLLIATAGLTSLASPTM